MRIGILISGRGSNMESLARACAEPGFPAEVAVVVSNKPTAGGLERAAELGLPTAVVDDSGELSREAFAGTLVEVLRAHDVEAVCLAGFMRLLPRSFLAAFPGRVLNVHPSLLPAFPGINAHHQALEYGVRYSGCTVHFVTEVMDAGPIILQAVVPVRQDDTPSRLAARVLCEEHRIYPQAVRLLAADRLRVDGRRVEILPADGETAEVEPAEGDSAAGDSANGNSAAAQAAANDTTRG